MQLHHVHVLGAHPGLLEAPGGSPPAHGVATEPQVAAGVEGVGKVGAHVLGDDLHCTALRGRQESTINLHPIGNSLKKQEPCTNV